MLFSRFARFGHFRFTGKRPVGQTIYHSLRDALGGDENLGEDAFTGPQAAELFATAMALAGTQRTIDRVNRERIPHRSEQFLGRHETDYKIVPPASSTHDDRRSALEIAEHLGEGCTPAALQDALFELLGTDLIAIRTATTAELEFWPADWDTTGPGAWKRSTTVAKWRTLTTAVHPGLQAIISDDANEGGHFIGGEVAVIDPGLLGIQEKVTIASSGSPLINPTATFVRSHEIGATITTEPFPFGMSNARVILIVVTATIAQSTAWRKKIASLMTKMLRAVDVWDVVEESAPGTLGPFTVGVGLIGITPIISIPTV